MIDRTGPSHVHIDINDASKQVRSVFYDGGVILPERTFPK
jgi:hypothetical protein